MPKSMTFTSPSYETSMFCGETSRCTMLERRPMRVALAVRVVEALEHLGDDEARHRHRHRLLALAAAVRIWSRSLPQMYSIAMK